jgi:hypothetical protein
MKYELYGKVYEVEAYKGHYEKEDGPLAIQLIDTEDGSPFCTLTVNLCDGMAYDNYTYIDTNNVSHAAEFIRKNKLGVFTGVYGYSGFCKYPLYRIYKTKLKQMKNL